MFFDTGYLLFVMLPALILSGAAQMYLRGVYGTWSQRQNSQQLTGVDTARTVMRNFGLDASLAETSGELSDHFDPREKIVRLSPAVARQPSVASMAIAAHEFGHVQQWQQGSALIRARSVVLPVAQFGSGGAYIMIILGLLMNFFALQVLGLLLFAGAVLFSFLTLPIEFDASRRAMNMLTDSGLLVTEEDHRGANAVLRAAALTYVAATAVALLNLMYYAFLIFGRRD